MLFWIRRLETNSPTLISCFRKTDFYCQKEFSRKRIFPRKRSARTVQASLTYPSRSHILFSIVEIMNTERHSRCSFRAATSQLQHLCDGGSALLKHQSALLKHRIV